MYTFKNYRKPMAFGKTFTTNGKIMVEADCVENGLAAYALVTDDKNWEASAAERMSKITQVPSAIYYPNGQIPEAK